MINASSPSCSNLCLLVHTNEHILYKPTALNCVAVVGYLSVYRLGPNVHAVDVSAATHGYGVLLYDVVMSHLYPAFVAPNREVVSNQARALWKKLHKSARYDMVPTPAPFLDKEYRPVEELSYAYRVKSKLDVRALVVNHKAYLLPAEQQGHVYRDSAINKLLQAAECFKNGKLEEAVYTY